eukprot:CAMPEP_0115848970 /NCGR_PEP_ID=MMETSP0287-20121206/11205_1 /TAXON_ID=412157 /ORGANISM="Chrysochromulina rotalis, Strain UIO044" /LENGTH=200 /DNA_ID=CAMNT_0003302917 /DNA_START=191 /DNA_END=790 /DNA_ORIENTATION=+
MRGRLHLPCPSSTTVACGLWVAFQLHGQRASPATFPKESDPRSTTLIQLSPTGGGVAVRGKVGELSTACIRRSLPRSACNEEAPWMLMRSVAAASGIPVGREMATAGDATTGGGTSAMSWLGRRPAAASGEPTCAGVAGVAETLDLEPNGAPVRMGDVVTADRRDGEAVPAVTADGRDGEAVPAVTADGRDGEAVPAVTA